MSTVVAAMNGTLGSTEYYIVTMKAKEVADKMKTAIEVEGWDDLSIEQKYQREINFSRVKREIAPYLAQDDDRFFGALIVAVQNAEEMEFAPVKEVMSSRNLQTASKSAANNLGFLTFSGAEILIPIDGQHRAKAINFAISGRDERNERLSFDANPNLAKDDITLMIIKFDTDEEKAKARKIFSKVNRYAKQPSKAENLITDDDDINAVFARRISDPGWDILSGDLVALKGNTLPKTANEFTTLSTIYEINKLILQYKGHENEYTETELPSTETQELLWKEVESVWKCLIGNIDHFFNSLHDRSIEGRQSRIEIRESFLLGKPIGQRVLAHAFLELTERGKIAQNEACDRLNALNWQISNGIWENVLTRDRIRVLSGIGAMKLGAEFVTYLLGRKFNRSQLKDLKERIRPEDSKYKLPTRVYADDWGG